MRIGLIGDVHHQDVLLEQAIELFRRENVDEILCVGDIVDGVGDLDRCCQLLQAAGVKTIRGNHERWALTGEMRNLANAPASISDGVRQYFESLPATLRLQTPAGELLLCHGVGRDDMARLDPETKGWALREMPIFELMQDDSLRFMVGGHTHKRMVRAFPGLTVINPGTLHDSENGDRGIKIIDLTSFKASWFRYDDGFAFVDEVGIPIITHS